MSVFGFIYKLNALEKLHKLAYAFHHNFSQKKLRKDTSNKIIEGSGIYVFQITEWMCIAPIEGDSWRKKLPLNLEIILVPS